MTRLAALLTTAVAALAVSHGSSRAATARLYLNVQGYGAKPVVKYRPDQLNRLTGDGTAYVTGIRWRGWNSPEARATGVAHVNDCRPSCAEGTFTSHATRLHAYAPRFCKAASRIVYSRLTITGLHVGGQAVIAINHDCGS